MPLSCSVVTPIVRVVYCNLPALGRDPAHDHHHTPLSDTCTWSLMSVAAYTALGSPMIPVARWSTPIVIATRSQVQIIWMWSIRLRYHWVNPKCSVGSHRHEGPCAMCRIRLCDDDGLDPYPELGGYNTHLTIRGDNTGMIGAYARATLAMPLIMTLICRLPPPLIHLTSP